MSKVGLKVLGVLVALAMLFTVVPGMTATAYAESADSEEGIVYLDAEIQVIDGQPMIVAETRAGYVNVPFVLSGDVLVQGNRVVVPTEEGIVVVPIEDFCVVMVDGQVALAAAVNPIFLIPIAVGALAGAGTAAGIIAAAKSVGVITAVTAKTVFWPAVGAGAVVGGAGGWFATRP